MRVAAKQIFLQVCDLDPEVRRKRLEELCGVDQALLQEVERLLRHDSPASVFDSPAPNDNPAAGEDESPVNSETSDEISDRWIGRTVQSYKLLASVGRGGMGEVYRAEDTRLKRPVAVKFLGPHLLRDDGQKRRFLREAQAAAALDHPSICPVYDVGEVEGHPYIVSAFIQGENLADVIRSRGLSATTAIDYAIQIAEGLQAAHRQGIIHRDIKPGNIILASRAGRDPRVKIIDFGLARISGSTELSELGRVIGTAAYIAPEILQGQVIDQRADLWSLGVVLYEMLAGQPPFDAENRERLFYLICHEDPMLLTAVRPSLPDEAARIVAKALEKDRTLRYQHASEIRSDLRGLKRNLKSIQTVAAADSDLEPRVATTGSPPIARAKAASGRSNVAAQSIVAEASTRKPWKLMRGIGFLALPAVLIILGVSVRYGSWQSGPELEMSRLRLTSNSSEAPVSAAAISPDGKYLAYADDTGIYLRVVETGESHLLSSVFSGFATSALSWFPDAIRIVASGTVQGETTSSIWASSILGGAPLKLRDDARGAVVAPNGSQIAFLNGRATEGWLMGFNGQEPRRFLSADEGYFLVSLAWFPDGERLGYLRRGHQTKRSEVSIWSRELKGSRSNIVFADPKLVTFCILSNGRMLVSLADSPVYPRSFDLWEVQTDPQTGQANSRPRRLSNWEGSAVVDISVTADGKRLVYLEGTAQYDVYTAELEGNGLRMKPPQRLTLDDSLDIPQAWTPDGREILFSSDRNGNLDTFKQALDQRTAEAILSGRGDQSDARLSSDGAWILYFDEPIHKRISATEPVTLRRAPFSGGPPQVALTERGFCCIHCSGSKANLCVVDKKVGDDLIFYAFDPVQGMGDELTRIHNPHLHEWQLSPDGSSIALARPEGGGTIRIISMTDKGMRDIRVSEPVDHFFWSSDGKGFYSTTVDTNVVPWAVAGGSHQKLLYIGLDGHVTPLWQFATFAGVYGFPSPDGRYLALGMGRMVANAWMVEGF